MSHPADLTPWAQLEARQRTTAAVRELADACSRVLDVRGDGAATAAARDVLTHALATLERNHAPLDPRP